MTFSTLLLCLLAWSCHNPLIQEERLGAPGPNDSIFIVQQGPYHFSMRLPKDQVTGVLPIIMFKENTGELIVSLSDQVYFKVTQQLVSMEKEEAALLNGGADIFQVDVVERDSSRLLYKTSLPDRTPVSYHFKGLIDATNLPYLVETDPVKRYNLEDVEQIMAIASTVSPL